MSEHTDTCTCGSGGGVCNDHPWHAHTERNNKILEAQNQGNWGESFELKFGDMLDQQEPGYEPPRDDEGNVLPSEPTVTKTEVVRRVLPVAVEGDGDGEGGGDDGEGNDGEAA